MKHKDFESSHYSQRLEGVYRSFCFSLPVSLYLLLSAFPLLCLPVSPSLCFSVFMLVPLCVYLCLSPCPSVSLFLFVLLSLPVSMSFCLCNSLYPSHRLCTLCLGVSLCFSVLLRVMCLSVSLALCLTVYSFLSYFISVSVSLSLLPEEYALF